MIELNDTIHGKFLALAYRREPEELHRDGEASETEVEQQLVFLRKQWSDLEYLVGRQVSEDEIWDKEYAKHRKV